jgi:pimeloyl-ACP methyl ester carboxylesterase
MQAIINGARIHYERSGSGFPVLLIHAGIADSRMWEPQAAALGDRFDLIRPDLRGFGESELPPAGYSMRADLIALLDLLKVDRAHVIGCSMGGIVAIDLTLENPMRVERLVLVGSGVGGSNLGEADKDLFADVDAAEASGDHDALNRAEVRLWVDGPRRPEGSAPAAVRELVLDMNRRALRTNFDAAPHQRLDPPAITRLHEITAPTLVIVGDEDLPHGNANADLLTSKISGARKAVIRGAAHLPSLERPAEFNRLVVDFFLGGG